MVKKRIDGVALADSPEARKQIFERLLEHARRGYSLNCFFELSVGTIKKYLEQYPEEFVNEKLEQAQRAGQLVWEKLGYDQAAGKCLGNSRSWWLNMAHRYNWSDRLDVKATHSGQVQVQVVDFQRKKKTGDEATSK